MAFHTFQQVIESRMGRLRPFNIVHPAFEDRNGTRQDCCPEMVATIVREARRRPDLEWLLVVDQGEHDTHAARQAPDNLHIFPRRFHMALYNWYGDPPREPGHTPSKWLFCPMGRADHIRTRWFDLLHEHDLVRGNNVSYLCTNYPQREPDPRRYAGSGGEGHQHLVPFNNFEPQNLPNDQRMRANWAAHHECLFGVSVETGSTEPQAWYTERAYNMIGSGQVPVIIAGMGGMSQLESLGFRVPDYINWRLYDQWPVDRWGEGLDKMGHIAADLRQFTQRHRIRDIARDWRPHAEHNRSHWNTLRAQFDREDRTVATWVMTLTHNLSTRRYQHLTR